MGEEVMAQPKVSVIIPIWNTEKYLEKCLDSIVNQTLKDIEIICVDNGSTDSSPEIIEKFAKNDSRIKVVTKEHGCLSSARNAGMEVATAPYMTFVDSDDWVEAECYEIAVKEFESNHEIDLVCWGANIVNIDLDENSSYITGARRYHNIRLTGKQILTDNIILASTVCVWNKMFKTTIVKEKQISFPLDVELEDNSFFYCYVSQCTTAYYLDKYLYNYVQRKNSGLERIRAGISPIIAPMMKNLEFILHYYKSFNILEKRLSLIERRFQSWLLSDYNDAAPANKSKVLYKAHQILPLLEHKLDKNILIQNLKKKNYNNVLNILFNKPCLMWGTNALGLFRLCGTNRYLIKILGIKISFKNKKEGHK